MKARSHRVALGLLLLAAATGRIAYVAAQPATDPAFARPLLDGAYYLDWARRLAAGESWPEGAYYLAPLYPHLLAGFLATFGESFVLLYLIQQALLVAAAWALASAARRVAGEGAALGTAAVALLSSPLLFFGSRPVGEAVALLLLSASLLLAAGSSPAAQAGAGLAAGLAALARPNLLLVPLLWALAEAARRRLREAAFLLAGVAVAIAPVAARNVAASGHLVLISSNAGITLYHGNGPGALGIYTPAGGLSGRLETQRQEATEAARARTGRDLDEVEADRWWGAQALRARAADPRGTARLLGRRLWLLLDNREHGLDYNAALDRNPWRFVAPLPFAALLGLATAGAILAGFRGTGGAKLWTAVAASAAAPVAYYASSRYRLPLVLLLSIPAGVGAARLAGAAFGRGRLERPRLALAAGLAAVVVSAMAPFGDLARAEEAGALANLASDAKRAGDLDGSERLLRTALSKDLGCVSCWYNLGVVLEARGRVGDAETSYRRALALDPGQAESAGNLAAILIRSGRAREALGPLREAIARRPGHAACRVNLVVALASLGDLEAAARAAQDAARAGVAVDPGLLESIGAGSSDRSRTGSRPGSDRERGAAPADAPMR